MKFSFTCTACGKSYQVDDMLAGKRTTCRKCGVAMRVPHPAIQLGPADGLPGSLPLQDVQPLPEVVEDIAEAQLPAPPPAPMIAKVASPKVEPQKKVKKFTPTPKDRGRFPAWIGHLISYALGVATAVAVIALNKAANPPAPPPQMPPDVEIQVVIEGTVPPNADEVKKLATSVVAAELSSRGIHVVAKASVVAIARMVNLGPSSIMAENGKPASTQPALREDLLNVAIEFRNSVDEQFWRQGMSYRDDPNGMNLHPEKLIVPQGQTLQQAVQHQQWKEAAERFGALAYPPLNDVRNAETAVPTPKR